MATLIVLIPCGVAVGFLLYCLLHFASDSKPPPPHLLLAILRRCCYSDGPFCQARFGRRGVSALRPRIHWRAAERAWPPISAVLVFAVDCFSLSGD